MKKSLLFLTLLFVFIWSLAIAQGQYGEHPVPMNGNDCSVCHAPGSTSETPAGDPQIYTDWQNSMHGINSVKCVTCHGDESTFLPDSNINTCLACHPNEAATINKKVENKGEGLVCTSCHKVHTFTVVKEDKPVHK